MRGGFACPLPSSRSDQILVALLDEAAARYTPSVPQQNAFKGYWLARLHVANVRGVAETIERNLPSYAAHPFRLHYRSSEQRILLKQV